MADTTFINGTVVEPSWLNDVNRFVYDAPTGSNTTGAALIGFLQAGTGAVTTLTAQNKLRQVINVEDFGAPLSGDAAAAFTNALNHAASLGGGVVKFTKNYTILTNITIPDNVHLQGEMIAAGQIQDGGAGGDYESLGSILKISSTATITVGSSASLSQCILVRDGLDLPFANLAAAQAGVPLFAGTAITIGGDDAKIDTVLILGFDTAILSTNRGRMRFYNVQGDCTNGIDVSNALDVVYLDQCHFWPFTTANYSWTASDTSQMILTRTGIAYHFHDTVDWSKISNCFSYGYFRGFRLEDANGVTVTACSADGPVNSGVPVHTGAIGVLIEGTSIDNRLTNVYCAGKSQAFYANATSGDVEFTSCYGVACTSGLAVLNTQRVFWSGGLFRNCSYGFDIQVSTQVRIISAKIRDALVKPLNFTTATSGVVVKDLDWAAPSGGASLADGAANWALPTVASADPLHLPGHLGNVFIVSGTTNFGSISGGYPGREVTLLFSGALTVANGGNLRLNGATSFTTAAGRSLTMVWDGTTWREIGRCT